MMRVSGLSALFITGLWALACTGTGGEGEGKEEERKEDGGDGKEEAGEPKKVEPGQIHVDYPTTKTDAVAGQFVLAPGRDTLDRALAEGGGTFIYYGATVLTPGDLETKVKSLAGTEFEIPNSLIVAIDADVQAKKGDVVLGHWESGSGLRRAIVTGGEPEAPVVRYLERAYDAEHAADEKEDTFQADRYELLTDAWQIGTTVACGAGDEREHGILVHREGDRILVSGFAAKLDAKAIDDCVSLPPNASFAAGDKVFVPVVGKFSPGEITKLEADVGRAWVKYEWGGAQKEEAFPIVDVTKSFEGLPSPTDDGEEADEGDKGDEKKEGAPAQPRPPREDRILKRPGSN